MKTFSNSTKKIKITFICDACSEDVPMEEMEIPETCDINITTTCPVCFKNFEVKVQRTAEKSWVEIEDTTEKDITIVEM